MWVIIIIKIMFAETDILSGSRFEGENVFGIERCSKCSEACHDGS